MALDRGSREQFVLYLATRFRCSTLTEQYYNVKVLALLAEICRVSLDRAGGSHFFHAYPCSTPDFPSIRNIEISVIFVIPEMQLGMHFRRSRWTSLSTDPLSGIQKDRDGFESFVCRVWLSVPVVFSFMEKLTGTSFAGCLWNVLLNWPTSLPSRRQRPFFEAVNSSARIPSSSRHLGPCAWRWVADWGHP